MPQPSLFDAPIQPPVNGRTVTSRHCSQLGAESAKERAATQCVQLLTLYQERGPLTDLEAAELLGVERSTVNARRNELVRRHLVGVHGTKPGPSGVRNTLWGKS